MKGGSSGLITLLLSALVFPLFFFILSRIIDAITGKSRLRREAYGNFRHEFSAAIAELNAGRKDIGLIVSEERVTHERAIYEVRGFLKWGKHGGFDAAANNYRKVRDSNDPAMVPYSRPDARTLVRKDDRQARAELLTAINKLLRYTPPK